MLQISEEPWRIRIEGPKLEVDFVQNRFSYEHPKLAMMKRRLKRLSDWDGMIKFYRRISEHFVEGKPYSVISVGCGFRQRLKETIEGEDIEYSWKEPPPVEPIPYCDDLLKGITLDDVQKECLAAMLKHKVCSIELGTGSGKTEIFFMAMACYLKKYPNAKILVVTSKKVLLRELEKRFKKRLPQYVDRMGLLGDSKADLRQIVVSTPNSSRDNDKLLAYEAIAKWKEGVDLLILDEAHHSRAKGWLEVVHTCKPSHLWAVSGKMVYHTSEIKTAELESTFGKPVYVGFSKDRTVPVIATYHYHPKWRGKFDDEGLYPALVNGVPVFHRASELAEWKEGVWLGPDDEGQYPEFMLVSSCCKSGFSDTGSQYICQTCGKECSVKPDRSLCGIYSDINSEVKLEPQPDSKHTIYWMPYDIGVMEFSDFNLFYAGLANSFSQNMEKWVMSVRRSRQISKFRNLFAKHYPDLRVGFVDGSLSGKKQLETFEKLERGELDGVVSQYVISAEGLDVPSLLHFIKLDNLSSEQVLEQQKGRVERLAVGKTCGYIHVPSMSQHESLDKAFLKIKRYYSDIRKLQTGKKTHKP